MFHGFLILWSGLSMATAATKLVELFCILDKSKRWFFVHVWNALVPPFFLRYKMGHCVLCPQKIARIICLTFCRTSNADDLLHPLVALVALVTLILFEVKKANSRRSWELQRLDRKAQCCSEAKPSSQMGARHSMLNNYFIKYFKGKMCLYKNASLLEIMRHSRARWNKLKQSGDSCGLRLLCFVGTRVGSLCQEQLRRFSTHGLRTLICGWRVPLGQQRRLDISFAWGYHRWGMPPLLDLPMKSMNMIVSKLLCEYKFGC